MAVTMRFMAKMLSKSLAATIRPRSACSRGAAKPPHTTSPSTSNTTDVGVLQQVVLLQQLHRLADDVAAAAGARGRAAGLDAHHAGMALHHEILGAEFLGVEVHALQHVDHGGDHALGEGEGAVVLGIAADLQHALAELGEGDERLELVVLLPMPPLP
jgi:hypothetical protein